MKKEIKPEELTKNPFHMIGKEWMLVTAEKDGKVNTMTASWGGLGVMWGKNVAFVFIRQTRYTKEFVDNGETFSLSFFGDDQRKMLNYMGTVSGRDADKVSECGLHVSLEENAPVFEEAELTLVCRKLFAQEMAKECFIDKEALAKWYGDENYHTMYVAEIVDVKKK